MPKISREPKPVAAYRLSQKTKDQIKYLADLIPASEAYVIEVSVESLYQKQIAHELKMSRAGKTAEAKKRIDDLNFNQEEQDFIWADWENYDEHLDWLLTASRKEIADWIEAGR